MAAQQLTCPHLTAGNCYFCQQFLNKEIAQAVKSTLHINLGKGVTLVPGGAVKLLHNKGSGGE
jgi:hypothetical protein